VSPWSTAAARGFLLAAAVVLTAAGCGVSVSRGPAASVGDVEYSADDFEAYLATVDPDNDAAASRADAAAWLTRWVSFALVEQQMADQGLTVSDAHHAQAVAELASADVQLDPSAPGDDVIIRQWALQLAAQEWAASEASEASDAADAGPALRVLCSRHILVATEAEADAVLARLDAGEPFGDLALELSSDQGSGGFGGDLGCVVEGSFVPEFETAAYAAEPGGDPVTAVSQFGVHVIEVISSGSPTQQHHPQLASEELGRLAEDVRLQELAQSQARADALSQALLTELLQQAFDRYADAVFIDERYGVWDSERLEVVVPTDADSRTLG